jgi:outer membrane protein TolC
MQHPLTIKQAPAGAKLLCFAASVYLFAPIDLIADSKPIGLVDDAIVVPFLMVLSLILWPRQILGTLRWSIQALFVTFLSITNSAHAARPIDAGRIKSTCQSQPKAVENETLLASGAGSIMGTTQPDVGSGPGPSLAPVSVGVPASILDSPGATLRGSGGPISILRGKMNTTIRSRKWSTDAPANSATKSSVAPLSTSDSNIAAPPSPGKSNVIGADSALTTPITVDSPVLKSSIVENDKGDDRSLGIVDALDEALLQSPRAAAIRANIGIARSNLAYATVQRNPYFFMDRGFVAEAVRRIGPTFTITPPWQTAFDLLVAKRQIDQAKLEILRDLWGLRADVRKAYTDAVITQETALATSNLLSLAEQTETVTSKKFQAGGAPEFDVLKAKLAREQAELDLKQAKQRVIKAKQQLNLLLGRTAKQRIQIPSLASADKLGARDPKRNYFLPDLSEGVADLDVFIDQARKSRWELTVIGQQIKVNKANLQNSYSNILPIPQLILGQSVSGNAPSGPKLNANFFTINAELPFTNLQQGDIAKYKATGKQLGWQMESQKNQVYSEISAAYNDLITFRDRIRLYKEHVLDDSQETARLARRSYEVGFTDITGVIQAQQSNFQVQLQYLDDVRSYQQAFIALEQAVGRPLQ